MTRYWDKRGLNVIHVRDGQGEIDSWWQANKNKSWNPSQGMYLPANYEPSDDELEKVEENLKETLDRIDERGEACLCEIVVKSPVTSTINDEKIPDSLVPSSNSLAVLTDGDDKSAVVPDSVTSGMKTPDLPIPRALVPI